MSALDWLMQRLGGDQQASGTDPRDLAAAFDKMSGPAADQAYWDWQRERYGASPPDQGGRDPQVGSGLPSGAGDRGIYTGAPMASPGLPQRDMPSVVLPPPGDGWPTIPWQMDRSLPRDFTFDDQPFRDTPYSRRNPPRDPRCFRDTPIRGHCRGTPFRRRFRRAAAFRACIDAWRA